MNVILHVHITIVTVVGSHSYILSNICLYEKLDGCLLYTSDAADE